MQSHYIGLRILYTFGSRRENEPIGQRDVEVVIFGSCLSHPGEVAQYLQVGGAGRGLGSSCPQHQDQRDRDKSLFHGSSNSS